MTIETIDAEIKRLKALKRREVKAQRTKKSKALCSGCREAFYNGNNPHGITECWNYKSAKVVKRWRISWWAAQDKAENFDKVETLTCRCDTGRFAYYERLPQHLGGAKP